MYGYMYVSRERGEEDAIAWLIHTRAGVISTFLFMGRGSVLILTHCTR